MISERSRILYILLRIYGVIPKGKSLLAAKSVAHNELFLHKFLRQFILSLRRPHILSMVYPPTHVTKEVSARVKSYIGGLARYKSGFVYIFGSIFSRRESENPMFSRQSKGATSCHPLTVMTGRTLATLLTIPVSSIGATTFSIGR